MEINMNTENYPHKVAAVYPNTTTAKGAIKALEAAAFADAKVIHVAPESTKIDQAIEPEAKATVDSVLNDAAIGGTTGTITGAAVVAAATFAGSLLFISAPIVGPLAALGYGAMIGGTAGAIHGLKLSKDILTSLVLDAHKSGYHIVIVHAAEIETKQRAQKIISETIAVETIQTQ